MYTCQRNISLSQSAMFFVYCYAPGSSGSKWEIPAPNLDWNVAEVFQHKQVFLLSISTNQFKLHTNSILHMQ